MKNSWFIHIKFICKILILGPIHGIHGFYAINVKGNILYIYLFILRINEKQYEFHEVLEMIKESGQKI